MRKPITTLVIALLLGALLFTLIDCSSTGGAPGGVPTVEETKAIIQGARVGYPPEEEAGAYGTFLIIAFIDIFVTIADLYLDTDIFDYQGSDGTYTYSFSGDGDNFTLTLKIVWDSAKGMWHYTLTISGTIDPQVYDNFVIFDMYATPDGSSGEISFYDPDSLDNYLKVNWIKEDPYITFTMTAEYDTDSFTVTLQETIPEFDAGQDQWVSESGTVTIDDGQDVYEVSWGSFVPVG
jgi:hypothetical protein